MEEKAELVKKEVESQMEEKAELVKEEAESQK